MDLPHRLLMGLSHIAPREVSYGVGGVEVFAADKLQDAQLGYSVTPDGASLCNGEVGAWQPHWIVIGYELGCGDPLIVDTSEAALPVVTAVHGQGAWEPEPVAISLEAFGRSLERFPRVSKGRATPVERDRNPLADADRAAFQTRIAEINNGAVADFWVLLLVC